MKSPPWSNSSFNWFSSCAGYFSPSSPLPTRCVPIPLARRMSSCLSFGKVPQPLNGDCCTSHPHRRVLQLHGDVCLSAWVPKPGYLWDIQLDASGDEIQWLDVQLVALRFPRWDELWFDLTWPVDVDGERVIHSVGWRISDEAMLKTAFNRFRERADGKDGTPAALKEHTHLYQAVYSDPVLSSVAFQSTLLDSYPIFSIDVFNAHSKSVMPHLEGKTMPGCIRQAWTSSETLIAATGGCVESLPDLYSLHVLRSVDNLCCILLGEDMLISHIPFANSKPLGVWGHAFGLEYLQEVPSYVEGLQKAKQWSVPGTYSDIVYKTSSQRMYCLVDVNHLLK